MLLKGVTSAGELAQMEDAEARHHFVPSGAVFAAECHWNILLPPRSHRAAKVGNGGGLGVPCSSPASATLGQTAGLAGDVGE